MFRQRKTAWREATSQIIPSGLIALFPQFRGTGRKSIQEAGIFLARLENLLEIMKIHQSRWGPLVTIGLINPEDSAFWREYLAQHPTATWNECRAQFLTHFDGYDQQVKYMDSIHTLAQKPNESVQQYFDSAAEIIRKAQVNANDPFIINCVRRGIRSQSLKLYLTYQEKPKQPFSFQYLRDLAIMGEDRLELGPAKKASTPKSNRGFTAPCFNCKMPGHKASECRKPSSSSSSSTPGSGGGKEVLLIIPLKRIPSYIC